MLSLNYDFSVLSSIMITSLWEERTGLYASCAFMLILHAVRFFFFFRLAL